MQKRKKEVLHGILGEEQLGGRVCGRAKLLAGTLRCLRLVDFFL